MNNQTHSIKLRPITPQDKPFLAQLYISTRDDVLALIDWSVKKKQDFLQQQFEWQHTQWQEHYPNASFDIVLIDDEPAGRLYVHRGKDEIRIMDIALLPDYRRRGVGAKLMTDLITEADQSDCRLTLHVEYNNPILGYYKRLGFEKKDTVGVYYFMKRKPQRA